MTNAQRRALAAARSRGALLCAPGSSRWHSRALPNESPVGFNDQTVRALIDLGHLVEVAPCEGPGFSNCWRAHSAEPAAKARGEEGASDD